MKYCSGRICLPQATALDNMVWMKVQVDGGNNRGISLPQLNRSAYHIRPK